MRVLWVNPFPVYGGPHNTALLLREPLRAAGVETAMLLPEEPGTAAPRLRAGGLDVITLPLQRLRRTRDPRQHALLLWRAGPELKRIRRTLRERSFDLVVLAGLTNPHGALAARLEGKPIVWQILDTATPAPVRAALMPLVRRWAAVVMFNGLALEALHGRGRALRQPTWQFTAPVDTNSLRPADADARASARRHFGIPPDAAVVGTIANLNPMKGIEWFIRAGIRIYAQRPDTWFLIAGAQYATHAGYAARLQREMRTSGVPAERWIFGEMEPRRCYAALDIKLITSVPASEGRTSTAPEAMACGVPVVATSVGAVPEVVEDGVTGLLVSPRDPDALAAAGLKLLSDPELRRKLGHEGRRRAVELYDVERCKAIHLEAFAAALRATKP